GNARINTKPDAAGNSATPTVTQQVDQFLAGNAVGANDLLVINGGIADIVAEMAKVNSGAQTSDQMIATVKQAGRDLGAQVRRLVQAGGAHVLVVGTYDLGKSPWATITGQATLLSDASVQFNLMIASPPSFNMTDATNPVCTSVVPGPGIGTGAGQVNSALCNTSTLL